MEALWRVTRPRTPPRIPRPVEFQRHRVGGTADRSSAVAQLSRGIAAAAPDAVEKGSASSAADPCVRNNDGGRYAGSIPAACSESCRAHVRMGRTAMMPTRDGLGLVARGGSNDRTAGTAWRADA
jgi:hypothetical protein